MLRSQDEFKERIRPQVVVEFAGIRKSTKVGRTGPAGSCHPPRAQCRVGAQAVDNNNDPFYEEDLLFKITDRKASPQMLEDIGVRTQAQTALFGQPLRRAVQLKARESQIALSVWDVDRDGIIQSPLGHCSVRYTQLPVERLFTRSSVQIDFATVFNDRVERKIHTRSQGKSMNQWVYESKMALEVPTPFMRKEDYEQSGKPPAKSRPPHRARILAGAP
jgi:hypothetical protein